MNESQLRPVDAMRRTGRPSDLAAAGPVALSDLLGEGPALGAALTGTVVVLGTGRF